MAPVTSQPTSSGVKLPAGMNLWDLIGLLIIFVGSILILVGFLFGDAYASQLGSGGSASTAQSDIEGFFIWTGVGIFLTILGWLFRVLLPMFMGRKRVASTPSVMATAYPSYSAPAGYVAPTAEAPVTPAPQPAPVAAPAAPACANCGKPTTYIAQYGRYYCYACARYV
jgi:hypothetical protein